MKESKYTVYRMTVGEVMSKFNGELACDPNAVNRPISFFYNDQFTYHSPLASPPPSDARRGCDDKVAQAVVPNSRSLLEGLNAQVSESGHSDSGITGRLGQDSQVSGSGLSGRSVDSSCAAQTSGLSERPTEEAWRGEPIGVVMKIADPDFRRRVLERRALAIGRHEWGMWTDLISLVSCEFHTVRRLAASAMKKLMEGDSQIGQAFFRPLIDALVAERYPQVQQYLLSALKRCAKYANREGVDYLRDVARDPTLSPEFRETANKIIYDAEVHHKLKESVHRHWCHRCKRPITKAESAAGLARYGKPYCKRCFDERALGDVNFENHVEEAKNRRTADGVAVQSKGEKRIADWLTSNGIPYEYDERFRIVEDTTIRPDFYLRDFDLYIEYWGMNTDRYNANRRKKQELYQREGRKLISLSWEDDRHLEDRLLERLSLHIHALMARYASSVGGSRIQTPSRMHDERSMNHTLKFPN